MKPIVFALRDVCAVFLALPKRQWNGVTHLMPCRAKQYVALSRIVIIKWYTTLWLTAHPRDLERRHVLIYFRKYNGKIQFRDKRYCFLYIFYRGVTSLAGNQAFV